MGICILYVVWILFGIHEAASQGDSLRSALNAVDQRQRYLFDNYRVPYARENHAELSYLPDSVSVGGNDLAEYFLDDNDVGKQISSLFRERVEEGREKPSQRVLSNYESDDSFDDSEYRVKDPWHKYRNNLYPRNARILSRNRKRQFYPEFGYDSIGLKKRDKFATPDYSNEYNYVLNTNEDYPNDYIDSIDYSRRSVPSHEQEDRYDHVRPNYWSNFRHIPVNKRSSEYPKFSKDKKQTNHSARTDPKVEKDLSTIFAGSDSKNTQKYPKNAGEVKTKVENQTYSNSERAKIEVEANETKQDAKKMSPSSNEKPIQIAKKSIDWTDYFGLDRRKKNTDNFGKEWLIERYHKAIAASKKNNEYPLESFHDNDRKSNKIKNNSSDMNLENLDRKLKTIEDEIVDDALKYTGANEGITDSKTIEQVEDGIISRLSKAYSVEKMRRALGEYRKLVDRERKKLEREEIDIVDDSFLEEKRVSVPRKQAENSNKEDQIEDNYIKCTQESGDCDEDNYKTPIEVIEQMNYEVGGCPKIQRACSQVEPLLGKFGKLFEEACNIHQMCLLCGNNNWYPATRQCNILYLSKVFDLCEGKTECQKELQKSVRHLININRTLRNSPSGDCNLVCPDGQDGL